MRSGPHLALSLAAGAAVVPVLDPPPGPLAFLGWAAIVGTLVDLDHFLIYRWRNGSWVPVQRCLEDPRILVVDQGAIFEPDTVGPYHRLLSHLVIAGALSGLLVTVSVPLAVGTAVVLYVHLLADVAWEVRRDRAGAGDSA